MHHITLLVIYALVGGNILTSQTMTISRNQKFGQLAWFNAFKNELVITIKVRKQEASYIYS